MAAASSIVGGPRGPRLPPWAAGVGVALLVALTFAAIIGTVYLRTEAAMIGEIHAGLERTARIAAGGIDVEGHATFVDPAQFREAAFQRAVEPLRAVLAADPEVAYAWTAVERGGRVLFVLDGSAPQADGTQAREDWVQIMEEFESPPVDLLEALRDGRSVVSQPYTDEWGTFVSAFEPLKDADGRTVAVLGIDLRLTKYEQRLAPVREASLMAFGLGLVVAALTGLVVWYGRKTDRTARELARQLRTVNALLAMSRALSAGVRLDDLLPVIIARSAEVMGAERAALLLPDEGGGLRAKFARGEPQEEPIVLPPGHGIAFRAVREGGLQNVADCLSDPDFESTSDQRLGVVSRNLMALPVHRGDGELIGVLEVINKIGGHAFDHDDEVLMEALGGLVLMAFDRARLTEAYVEKQKLDEALKLAASIQMSMVPHAFPAAGEGPVELHAELVPAKEVGGDFYDFFWLDERRMALVIADVSGKGMPAALFMAKAKTLVKAAALLIDDPGEILRRANDELSLDNDAGMFVTLFLGILDVGSGQLVYSNAGHNHPLRLHGGGLEPLRQAEGVALGVMEGLDYPASSTAIAPGDVLFLYTDGVNEAMNPAGEPWGNPAMEAVVAGLSGSMAERNRALLEALRAYAGGAEQSDDITLLSLHWPGRPLSPS